MKVEEIRVDLKAVQQADKGVYCSIPVTTALIEEAGGKLRRADKVYLWSEE